ncbi:MAG: hypothetical protein IH933_15200 [Euryarchaeota archaeon]|nr:hypothetical protein [Euryarchaeota archaeon]
MTWHAIRAAGESVAATKALLADASVRTWLRLSVLVLFVGTLITPFLVDFNNSSVALASIEGTDTAALLVVTALVFVLFLCVGTVFEFVFIDALRGESAGLVAGSERRFHPGMQVFALRFVLFVVAGGSVLVAAISLPTPWAIAAGVVLVSLLLLLDRLTVGFVVPIMLVGGCSLAAGWRTFAPTLGAQWREYLLYLLVAGVLWLAIAIVGGLVSALFALGLLVPFGTLGVAVSEVLFAQGLSEAVVTQAVLGTLALPYLFVFFVFVLLIHVPLIAYLRYIELFVLGDTTERHDPIPQLRTAIRRE